MIKPCTERKVARILVMLQYDDAADGEVFDLTALAREVAEKGEHRHAMIEMKVVASKDYSATRELNAPPPLKTDVRWNVMADFHSSGDAGFLDDAINSSLPDSFATQELRKKLNRLADKVESLRKDVQAQRLMDAAAVRHAHPIARVRETPALAAVAESTQPNSLV